MQASYKYGACIIFAPYEPRLLLVTYYWLLVTGNGEPPPPLPPKKDRAPSRALGPLVGYIAVPSAKTNSARHVPPMAVAICSISSLVSVFLLTFWFKFGGVVPIRRASSAWLTPAYASAILSFCSTDTWPLADWADGDSFGPVKPISIAVRIIATLLHAREDGI